MLEAEIHLVLSMVRLARMYSLHWIEKETEASMCLDRPTQTHMNLGL